MKIYIASDHGGYALKQKIETALEDEYSFGDMGCNSTESCDYPFFGQAIGETIVEKSDCVGIALCGSGIGISMAANKVQGARAALCHSVETAKLARQHNGANILCLGERVKLIDDPIDIVKAFLTTEIDPAERHQRRREQLDNLKSS